MDELAAAAAVVSLTIDPNADDEMGQRGACGTVSADDAAMPDVEATSVDKENAEAHAAVRHAEDVPSKVSNGPQMPRSTPSMQHLT